MMPMDRRSSASPRPSWRTTPRRVLMHFGLGRRLWWRTRKSSEVDFWAAWLNGAPGTEQWTSDRESRLALDTQRGNEKFKPSAKASEILCRAGKPPVTKDQSESAQRIVRRDRAKWKRS